MQGRIQAIENMEDFKKYKAEIDFNYHQGAKDFLEFGQPVSAPALNSPHYEAYMRGYDEQLNEAVKKELG